jgi:hypothetical protein
MTMQQEKKPVRRPASCEEFLTCLDGLISDPDSKARLPKVLRLINQGFGPDPHYRATAEEIERIERRLMEAFEPIDLSLRLLIPKAKKQAFLLRDLRNIAATKVRRDLAISPVTSDEERDQLSATLSGLVNSTTSQEELVALMRKAVIALAVEPNAMVRSQLLNELLEQAADHRSRKFDASKPVPKAEPYQEQLSEALRIVSKGKVDFRTVLAARKLGLPIQVEVQERRKMADAARRDKIAAEEELRQAEAECKTFNERVGQLESQLALHQIQLRQNETEIELEKKRSHEIRETLTSRHAHELDGQLRRIAKALMLEAEEARVCLDREEPNAKMALNRILDLQTILKPYLENKA